MPWAGGKMGENFACQGNILTGEDAIASMAQAFESGKGNLGNKMIAALEAAEIRGGDSRGTQSAALIIEQTDKGRAGYGTRKYDLRVEDNENPIAELKRIYEIADLSNQIFAIAGGASSNTNGSIGPWDCALKQSSINCGIVNSRILISYRKS